MIKIRDQKESKDGITVQNIVLESSKLLLLILEHFDYPSADNWSFGGAAYKVIEKGEPRYANTFLGVLQPGIVVVLLICIVSPLNASGRYYLPVMAVMPVYLGLCAGNKKKDTQRNEKITE